MKMSFSELSQLAQRTFTVGAIALLFSSGLVYGQRPVIPGTGMEVAGVADDFEDPSWSYIPNNPKSTEDIDERQRGPMGKSTNGRWYEGIKRGHPDVVQRVATPAGGLPGSQGALLMRSKMTGLPGQPSGTMHQDDFICNVQYPPETAYRRRGSTKRHHTRLPATGCPVGTA